MAKFNTIDDFEVRDKTVLMRIDINSPVDPNSGIILDDTRMKLHAETIRELSSKGAKTVILAHQSRPGKKDFTTLEQHAVVLSNAVGLEVKYVDSVFSSKARDAIQSLNPGEILLLENVRFFSEEQLKRSPEEEASSVLVKTLTPLVDLFINDAFAAAHRSQTSLVGFTQTVPSAAGRVMEKELTVIGDALENVQHPCVFALGGMKADDSIMVTENVLENGTADYVLVSGLVANIFIWAAGYDIKSTNKNFIRARGYADMVEKCRELIERFGDKIVYPEDVAISVQNDRADVTIENIPDASIFDIGRKSLINYSKIIRSAKTIFANGPAGVFENPKFAIGTEDIINAIASSDGFSIIGGGHIAAATVNLGYGDRMDHISSGGGASINMLAGKSLAAVEALEKSAELFKEN
ncbi:phosphoglycerate kinase [uncultured Methanobrevibacter sp.]|uniref:phosphoglycerate kinase n=1 Tax=uncultured Methanobrevibacter sp. TaxID=253161 RepID=UPI00260EB2B7